MTVRWAAAPTAAGELRLPVARWGLVALGVFLVAGALASTGALVLPRRRLARLCRELPVLKRIGAVSDGGRGRVWLMESPRARCCWQRPVSPIARWQIIA